MTFTGADHRQLEMHGVPASEAERQLALLGGPPSYAHLDRPCTPGDGIELIGPERAAALQARAAAAAAAGRLSAFVPASGAATRMFKELLAWRARPGDLLRSEADAEDSADAAVVRAFADGLGRFAFWPELSARLGEASPDVAARGALRPVLDALLGDPGLGYAALPKGLIAFHCDATGARTAFEEHLREAAALLRGADGVCRVHVTVSPEHRNGFEACLADVRRRLEPALGVSWDVQFSVQENATDTLAADPAGGPFRGADGRLVLRPAGHGALIANLERCGGDLVLLKNIDNVTVDARRAPTMEWSGVLFGRLLELEEQAGEHLARLDRGAAGAAAAALAWAHDTFGTASDDAREALERPIRVCGMVRNTGEPGGGPFWVGDPDGGVTPQIVESAQVDPASASQQAIARSSTHFNPVFMVCALRDRAGRPWPLHRYVDERAVIVTPKSSGGRDLLALERPGLWNGAMARWNTVFVDVPLDVFNPVKTVLDLLRSEHQGS
jgi:hypothetical protein